MRSILDSIANFLLYPISQKFTKSELRDGTEKFEGYVFSSQGRKLTLVELLSNIRPVFEMEKSGADTDLMIILPYKIEVVMKNGRVFDGFIRERNTYLNFGLSFWRLFTWLEGVYVID